MAETIGIGILGGAIGVGVGVIISVIVGAIGPGLSVTSTGLAVGASTISNLANQSTTASVTRVIHLSAPIHFSTILLAFLGALLGGVLAGIAGGWRAARLAPASALRDLG
jgi:ABC-type antimicrobial peptide transport system permease subunit